MKEQLPFQLRLNQNLTDLNPVVVGEGRFHTDYYTGPLVAGETYMVHYVRCGNGEYLYHGKAYPFHGGQLIISKPGDVANFYSKDTAAHWALRWISFNGALAHRFSELPPIVDAPPGTFENLCDLNKSQYLLEYKLASELLFLYSALLSPQKQKVMTDVEWVKNYVAKNYMNHISVVELAKQVGLDPDYLTRKFKKQVKLNIQSYIIQARVTNSRTFLGQGFSVKETAAKCGFNEVSSFSRAFKKYDAAHRSPSDWQRFYIEFHRKRKEE